MNQANETNDRARLAHLKRAFHGELTEEENKLLEAFDASSAGSQFAASVAELQTLLTRVADVKVPAPRHIDLRARFEARAQAEARQFQRRFVRFCLGVFSLFAIAGALATVVLNGGTGTEHLAGLWILLGLVAAAICLATWERTSRVLRSSDVTRLLDREREPTRRGLTLSTRTVFVGLLCATLLARSWGWPKAMALAVASLVLMRLAAHALGALEKRRRMREDAAMWEWWYRGADQH